MKHSLWICFLLTLLVSGCTREEMLQNGTSASGGRVFTTSFENDESRTYLEDGLYSRWTEGDRISLFDASTLNRQYLFAGETGDSRGTFFMLSKPEGTGTALSANYAVYPYSEDVKLTEEGTISVSLPSEQHYAENSYGLGDNMMVAVTENTDDTFLSFKNVGGAFKLQLYGDDVMVKSITLMGNNGEKIAGKATITAAYDKVPIVTMADDATNTITLDCGEEGVKIGSSAENATTFWVVVPPVTLEKGITVVIKDINNNVFTQTTDKQLEIERNVVKPMAKVKVEPKFPQLAFSADEKELEGWSAGLFAGEGTYVMGKPHSENGYMMTIGNVLENESAIVYMDESRQVREIFVDNTIIAFGENANGGVDVAIIEKDGKEKVEHIVLPVNAPQSRSSNDYGQQAGSIDLVLSLKDLHEITKEVLKNNGDFTRATSINFLVKEIELINNVIRAAGGPDLLGEFWGELGPWLDKGESLLDMAELAPLYKAAVAGGGKGGLVGAVIAIYANLLSTGLEILDECILSTYGNCVASISDINYGNNTLNIDVNVSGYETTNSEVECGVIVRKSNAPFAPPVGKFPSDAETKIVTGNGNYSFSIGGIEEGQSYWCYPYVIEVNRVSIWVGFIGDMAGPFVRYGKAVKYEPEEDPLREALIKLYQSTNGDNWTHNDNWCSDKPVEEWFGVLKNENNQYGLYLNLNNLTGKIDQTFPDNVTDLWVDGNQLTSLNVSGSRGMVLLYCDENKLTSLNVSSCTALIDVVIGFNQLKSINAADCASLRALLCDGQQLTSLNVSGCTALEGLHCSNNQLTSLNVSSCTALEVLSCSNNQLISLNVSSCTALEGLYCSNNQLTTLNISGCTALNSLGCNDNKITSVIPDWFSQITLFTHDERYRYWQETIPLDNGGFEVVIKHEDNGYGWWYPGEPEKGYHGPN